MRAGKLRHKITIQKATDSQNGYGEAIPTWSTYCIRRAGIETGTGDESIAAAQLYGRRPVTFNLRHDSLTGAITPKMRVSWDSRLFDIRDMNFVNERNREVLLTCLEVL